MKEFSLQIVTLDGVCFDASAVSVVVRSSVGDVCILANHADYVTPIDVGRVKIKTKDKERFGACTGGFLSVSDNKVRIVATTFEFSDEIDEERAKKAKKRAEERIAKKISDKDMQIAELKLKKALLRLNIADKK